MLAVESVFDRNAGTALALDAGNDTLARAAALHDDEVLFIELMAGWSTGGPAVNSLLDGIVPVTANSDVAHINRVPEPAGILLLAVAGLLAGRRRVR